MSTAEKRPPVVTEAATATVVAGPAPDAAEPAALGGGRHAPAVRNAQQVLKPRSLDPRRA